MTTTAERIAELTAAWEDAVSYGEWEPVSAADYALSEDDWKAGLSDDEAAEIVALIERQAEQRETAERIAHRIAATMTPHGLGDGDSPHTNYERALIAAALAMAEEIEREGSA